MDTYKLTESDKEALFITAKEIRDMNDEINATLLALSAPGCAQAYREEIWSQLVEDMQSVDARLLTLGLQPLYANLKQDMYFFFVEFLSDK